MSGPRKAAMPSDPPFAPLDADVKAVGPHQGAAMGDPKFDPDNPYHQVLQSMRDEAARGTPSGFIAGTLYEGLTSRNPHGLLDDPDWVKATIEGVKEFASKFGGGKASPHSEHSSDDGSVNFESKLPK